jgi:type I restriction enzyme S subunit
LLRHIRTKTRALAVAIARLEREIELLGEYRTRLVADVATGKLDVREAATRLPDQVPLETFEEDIDFSIDPDAHDEEAVA